MNGHLLTQLIAYIASPAGGNCINQHMTPLQMFRLTMESLGNGNVLSKGIFMQTVGAKSVGAEVCYSEFVPCLLILSHPCPSCSLCESIFVLVPSPKIHTTVSFPKKHNSLKFVISIASSLFNIIV